MKNERNAINILMRTKTRIMTRTIIKFIKDLGDVSLVAVHCMAALLLDTRKYYQKKKKKKVK